MSTKTAVSAVEVVVWIVCAALSYGATLLVIALLAYYGVVPQSFADGVSATPEHVAFYMAGALTPLAIIRLHRWFNK